MATLASHDTRSVLPCQRMLSSMYFPPPSGALRSAVDFFSCGAESGRDALTGLWGVLNGDGRRLKGAIQRSTETGLAVEMPSRTVRQASHESIEDSMNSYGSEGKILLFFISADLKQHCHLFVRFFGGSLRLQSALKQVAELIEQKERDTRAEYNVLQHIRQHVTVLKMLQKVEWPREKQSLLRGRVGDPAWQRRGVQLMTDFIQPDLQHAAQEHSLQRLHRFPK
ncbi:hypothetical protein DV515_00010381 [Chloebia gouldiae]|uniref:Uncharacterized protein n=1 Tax=Chloebia gouldiae TaxID=44316 RepID=A0A3L8SAK7_CHLGU|nr:hypothetical protein DV515_00010381 [Chloebia gouldiae]